MRDAVARISSSALKEVQNALKAYETEVNETNLASNTRATYLLHADHFVRWLAYDFTPGERAGRHPGSPRPGGR